MEKIKGYKNNRTYKAGYEYLLAYKITTPIYDYLENKFVQKGGFRENLFKKRLAERRKSDP